MSEAMTKEALSIHDTLTLALEALEYFSDTATLNMDKAFSEDAITAIKEALAQPEQHNASEHLEPVAWIEKVRLDWLTKHGDKPDVCTLVTKYESGYDVPLYTTPPQRTWVGLSHDEYDAICDKHSAMSDFDFLEAIEAKLKEKNT